MEVITQTSIKNCYAGIHIGSYSQVLLNFLNVLRNRITYRSVHVLFKLLNALEKSDKMRGLRSHEIECKNVLAKH